MFEIDPEIFEANKLDVACDDRVCLVLSPDGVLVNLWQPSFV